MERKRSSSPGPLIVPPVRSAADITREQLFNYVLSVTQDSPGNIAKLVKEWLKE